VTAAIFASIVGDRSAVPASNPSFEVRFGTLGPDRAVYLRRRMIVAILFVAFCAVIGLSAHSVLADHGGVPASTPVVLPAVLPTGETAAAAAAVASAVVGTPYLVQPGDSIWSIAEARHGSIDLTDYVESLVAANGGPALQAGQMLTLP